MMNSIYLFKIYQKLLAYHGPQNWWPASGFTQPREWEICIGAILTQNTSWGNVEKALENLKAAKCRTPRNIAGMDLRKLQQMIKPSGFYRQKAQRLKLFSGFVIDNFRTTGHFLKTVTRDVLLRLNGIGKETADSVLLYACGRPYFVVDAYTKRIFSRIGIVDASWNYEQIRALFESNLPKDIEIYKEFHALIVRHAKECCRKQPNGSCILKRL